MANYSNEITNAVVAIDSVLRNDTDALQTLTWICNTRKADVFSRKNAEECTSFLKLFNVLSDYEIIRPDDVSFLAQILRDAGKMNLASRLDGVSQGGNEDRENRRVVNGNRQIHEAQLRQEPNMPQVVMVPREELLGEDLMPHFEVLVPHIGRDWRFLGRQLGLTEFDFETIMELYPRNLREQVMKMLTTWKERYRVKATKAVLVKTLRKCRMNLAGDILEKMQITST